MLVENTLVRREDQPAQGRLSREIKIPGGRKLCPELGAYTQSWDTIQLRSYYPDSPNSDPYHSAALVRELQSASRQGLLQIGTLTSAIIQPPEYYPFTLHTFSPPKQKPLLTVKQYLDTNKMITVPTARVEMLLNGHRFTLTPGKDCVQIDEEGSPLIKLGQDQLAHFTPKTEKDFDYSKVRYTQNQGAQRMEIFAGVQHPDRQGSCYVHMIIPFKEPALPDIIDDGILHFTHAAEHAERGNYTSVEVIGENLRSWSQRSIDIGAATFDIPREDPQPVLQ